MYDTRVTSSHFKDKSYSSRYPPPPPPRLPPPYPKLPDVDSFNCFAQLAPFSLKRLYTAQRTRFEFGAVLAEKKFISPSVLFGFLKQSFPEDIIKSNEGKSLPSAVAAWSNMLSTSSPVFQLNG